MSMFRQQVRRITPGKLRPFLGELRRRLIANPVRIAWQRGRLIENPSIDQHRREVLGKVSLDVHYRDGMYSGNGADYFLAGLSALESVEEVLAATGQQKIREVLDMPSGYGRELRFFVQRFPQARFTACDIQRDAVDFCARAFGATPVYSQPDLKQISFDREFDLIWCGSLITHLDDSATVDLLTLFARHLRKGGLMIVTTNGELVAEKMRAGATYDLPPENINRLLERYAESGYAYSDYASGEGYFDFHPAGTGYGVSLMSPEIVRKLAAHAGEVEEVYFQERGWADHQDLFAFRRED